MSETVTLDYAKGVPRWRRRMRRGIYLLMMLAFLFAGWHWRHDISRHVEAWRWQRECVAYTLPPTEIVYEELGGAEVLLRTRPGDYLKNDLPMRAGVAALRRNDFLKNMNAATGWYWTPYPQVTVFMHKRVSRHAGALGGNSRLVSVTLIAPSESRPHIYLRVWELGSPLRFPELKSQDQDERLYLSIALMSHSWTVKAGQADPADASHFTFEFELRSLVDGVLKQAEVVDGWLEADDSITLKPRHEIAMPGWP